MEACGQRSWFGMHYRADAEMQMQRELGASSNYRTIKEGPLTEIRAQDVCCLGDRPPCLEQN